MSTRIALHHRLDFAYPRRVQHSTHWLRLRPAPHRKDRVEAYSLKVQGEPHFLNWLRDPYENHLARLDLPDPVARLGIAVELIVAIDTFSPFDFLVEPQAFSYPLDYPPLLARELAPYLGKEAVGPRFSSWLSDLRLDSGYIVERLGELNRRVYETFPAFGPILPAQVNLESVCLRGAGSPWEIAWLMTVTLRYLGLAARFTSGYHVFLSQAGSLPDAARLHAWCEVYLPGAGWIGLDPSSGTFTAEGYIPLASAPEPLRTLPVTGFVEACEEARQERVSLVRLDPAPLAWPYGEAEWSDIRAVGDAVDAELSRQAVELSLGTSLSFVSATSADLPEWTSTALGPDKLRAAEHFIERMRARIAPGGVVQIGQGEWYGGEELPRWRLNCLYRADEMPLLRDGGLLRANLRVTVDEARRFAESLADALGIPPGHLLEAYEDGLYHLWTQGSDLGLRPLPSELLDPDRRRQIAADLSRSRGEPAGFVLPLRWDAQRQAWASGRWSFRRGALYLMPGGSPLGYRLPLDSLAVGEQAALEADPERCQFEERAALPELFGETSARFASLGPPGREEAIADATETGSRPPRTAICVQVRQGRIYVFLPPLTHLEHYLDLVAAVEAASAEIDVPLSLEGYEPPEDFRLRRLVVEPDAGSLRITLPKLAGWEQQLELIQAAYEEAARVGLRAERRLSDGSYAPPGGRSEIRLGAERPADSPFFRRPELLRGLIAYWQRHPSLSYFFAGRSVGPGGAAPRPDEGRDEVLYELSLALERIPAGENRQPWVPDRLLRHLLADPSGDMRRAEIRVDQLFPPDRSSLRLGRTIVRSFETPPHARLAALQALLVKGLVACSGRLPPTPLEAWDSALHDRFMLPAILWNDLLAVIDDLGSIGLPFQASWFQPFLDLHFPVLGRLSLGEIELELRQAHEPRPVLAEEATGNGIARFVDSANERLQVSCAGLSPSRHILVCNGHRVPLRESGSPGEWVAGVRFKASNPPSTLHPTRAAVYSLVFDLLDAWTGKVVGGCSYFPPPPALVGPLGTVAGEGPAGEGRQEYRPLPPQVSQAWGAGGVFLASGSGLDKMAVPRPVPDPRFPYSLDLARL